MSFSGFFVDGSITEEPFCDRVLSLNIHYLANIYLFKVNNRNTRKRCEMRSKLTIKTAERRGPSEICER